ncbi:hypothetical protein DL93DRAFT_727407 [Clavulina sp. PMI_390]|nr:hypothetical protein DL93DRAFT_727407 [Clavulina sp. PMI_390]
MDWSFLSTWRSARRATARGRIIDSTAAATAPLKHDGKFGQGITRSQHSAQKIRLSSLLDDVLFEIISCLSPRDIISLGHVGGLFASLVLDSEPFICSPTICCFGVVILTDLPSAPLILQP